MEYRRSEAPRTKPVETKTVNVCTGGVYFETSGTSLREGEEIQIELGIPPGDGRFPKHGKIATVGKVLRVKTIEDHATVPGVAFERQGVAAEFKQGLKLSF